jgi:hypothetical protein
MHVIISYSRTPILNKQSLRDRNTCLAIFENISSTFIWVIWMVRLVWVSSVVTRKYRKCVRVLKFATRNIILEFSFQEIRVRFLCPGREMPAKRHQIKIRYVNNVLMLHVQLKIWFVSMLWQGYGTLLMEEAERIAHSEHRLNKLAVISGVGTRHCYRKLGYELEGPYMAKNLSWYVLLPLPAFQY